MFKTFKIKLKILLAAMLVAFAAPAHAATCADTPEGVQKLIDNLEKNGYLMTGVGEIDPKTVLSTFQKGGSEEWLFIHKTMPDGSAVFCGTKQFKKYTKKLRPVG